MNTTTAPQVIVPSAVLQFTKQMDQLQKQVDQHNEAMKAITQATAPLLNAGKIVQQKLAEITRAHVFLVEQYQKSARAKQKKAHAHLVAVCQSVAGKLRKFLSLREVAAEFYKHTAQDMRTVWRELLLVQHQANAPNGAQGFLMTSHLEVAITT
jgi:DUF438 domain-containing protein